MRNMNEEPIPPASIRSASMDFERELLYAFRGELRKINEMLPEDVQNTGTAFRMAASAIGHALKPQSDIGKLYLERYMKQRPPETLYSPVGLGAAVKKAMDRVSVLSLTGETKLLKRKRVRDSDAEMKASCAAEMM